MKQRQIKENRYYRGRSGKIRLTVKVDHADKKVYYRCSDLHDLTNVVLREQPLKSFAQWTQQEVVPSFSVVRRCSWCDSILQWDPDSFLACCDVCSHISTVP